MESLVSVIVPVYNAEKYLCECIQSIIDQTYTNIELWLIDDGSTDSSAEICSSFANADFRVHYLKTSHEGVSTARNIGLEQANGRYVCFVDSDDYLEFDYIEKLYEEIHDNCLDLVFCNYKYLYGNKQLKKASRIPAGKYVFDDIAGFVIDDGTVSGILFGSVCFAIYDLTMIKKHGIKFEKTIKRNEDGLFNLCALQKSTVFSVTEYNGYLYRQWKKTRKKSLELDCETEKATEKIKEYCNTFPSLDKQLRCRCVSIAFWNSMSLASANRSIISICSAINKYLDTLQIKDYYQDLNLLKINKFKKVLITMLKNKHTFMFVFVIKYVYPLLNKIIKR